MKPAIGLEIHVQLNTKSKLFCSCSTEVFGVAPNSRTCPVCNGDPGVLPVTNKAAVERLIQMGLALNCTIAERSIFARKNYFYPDLPKNYQISQYEEPLAGKGRLDYYSGGRVNQARIHRVHLEEDAGKLLHAIGSQTLDCTLVDFNRAGIPLAETVTEPDFLTSAQASDFLVTLRATLRALGASNCDMEKGEMRVDVNVSVSADEKTLGTKVEIKNLNSFKSVRDALEYEITRQREAVARGEKIVQETRLWDVKKAQTVLMRTKEGASDYRYFAEPDLPAICVDEAWISELKKNLPPLPTQKMEQYQNQLGLGPNEAQALVFHEDAEVARLFDETVKLAGANGNAVGKIAANWILNDLLGQLKTRGLTVAKSGMSASRLAGFIKLTEEGGLTSRLAKDLLNKMLDDPALEAAAAFKESGVQLLSGDDALLPLIKKAIQANPKAVSEYKAGKEKAIQSLIGFVMRETRGQAHPQKLQELLKKELTP
ncbi:MAG: Asp-tRNA(Asn)/Glu-tRNA(Gln) amidotransferase subunit GatB [Elusimicrobia bacterium]|nr:Asp-tRNA(Asn)/Glu-tRNA(Gln) amidotransferase subunit GatB [Elusimicrobiota bacterium]